MGMGIGMGMGMGSTVVINPLDLLLLFVVYHF